ncbi:MULTISPECIES: hypothetical protein [unclassified Bartonella]
MTAKSLSFQSNSNPIKNNLKKQTAPYLKALKRKSSDNKSAFITKIAA